MSKSILPPSEVAMPSIPGPRGPIDYTRDAHGYPRVRARDERDGAFAMGWMHATDRLVQVNLTLLAATGRLMEFLGDTPFTRTVDHSVRALDFAGDVHSQAAAMGDEIRGLANAYCRGFNAGADRRGLPWPMRALGATVEHMTPASVMLIYRLSTYFGLVTSQQLAEAVVAELLARGGGKRLATTLLGDAAEGLDTTALDGLRWPAEFGLFAPPAAGGSNAFAVSAARSASGGALLMAEPHMEIGRFPPVLYFSHVDYPDGGYVQGAGVPGLAWPSIGRTKKVGWSYTYGHGDNVDIVAERCREGQVQVGDDWRPLRSRTERVAIRGQRLPEEWSFWQSEYGTVIGDAGGPQVDLPCIRWTGMDQLAREFDAIPALFRARDVAELAEAHRPLRSLSFHVVMADDGGRVGYVQTGQIDWREDGWSGAVPGKGWELTIRPPEVLPEEARPLALDPPSGIVVSANEGVDGPGGERWCNVPAAIYRKQRMTELLEADEPVDLDRLVRVSYDHVDLCAARLMPIWRPLLPDLPRVETLADWAAAPPPSPTGDHRDQMALFTALHAEAVRALLAHLTDERTARRFVDELCLIVIFQHHLDEVLALKRPDVLDERRLRPLLRRAWPLATARVDAGQWQVPVKARFRNVLFRGKAPAWLGMDSPEVTLPGGPCVPFQSRHQAFAGNEMVFGPVFHMVFDMSKPGGWFNIPGGASERRLGPGYGVGLRDWMDGRFAPLGDAEGEPPRLRY